MNLKKIILSTALVIIIVGPVGCKKKEQPTPKPAQAPTMEKMKHTATKTAEEANKTAETMAASMEQTVCPVTGIKIDKNVFVEYKGKKVYFCCTDCKAKFEADPEKYVAKLPQFAK
jgi:YHS domain-containing protein